MATPAHAIETGKRGRRVVAFGPDDCLLGSINLPPRRTSDSSPRIGAILWGLGIAEMKTARRLAKRGIPSLQVRINNVEFSDKDLRNDTYDRRGIEFCRLAMDHLAAETGVGHFILMGNCACASFSFNAAMRDERVVGLILTNPHITKRQLLDVSLWHKLTRKNMLKRVMRGDVNFAENLSVLAGLARRRLRRAADRSKTGRNAAPAETACDFELPDDFAGAVRRLATRGVKTFLACARTDDSMHYMRTQHGTEIDRLVAAGGISFACIESSVHVFSRDDDAATSLNEAISDWVDTTAFSNESPATPLSSGTAPAHSPARRPHEAA